MIDEGVILYLEERRQNARQPFLIQEKMPVSVNHCQSKYLKISLFLHKKIDLFLCGFYQCDFLLHAAECQRQKELKLQSCESDMPGTYSMYSSPLIKQISFRRIGWWSMMPDLSE